MAAKPLVQRRYEKSYRLAPFATHFGMPVNRPSGMVYGDGNEEGREGEVVDLGV